MKHILYILLIVFSSNQTLWGQCAEPDGTVWNDTWRSCTPTDNPISEYGESHWIQYNFGSVRNLSKSWVWNTNESGRLEQGFKNVHVDYSLDGEEWTNWGEMTFPKANGDAVYGGFPGPDLSNIQAQFILITAVSNYGDESCFGISEIKFNLLPELGEPTENDDDDDGECAELANVEIQEFVEVEAEMTEAFIFLEELEDFEDLFIVFEYRSIDGEWIEIEVEEEEIELYDLEPGTVYEYRFKIECEDEFYTTETSTFETISCQAVTDIYIEEITATEAFFLWEESDFFDFYLVEIGIAGEEEKDIFDVEEAELFLEDLEEDTDYELRIGIECGEDNIVWSEIVFFTTQMDDIISNVSDEVQKRNISQINLFPNPTSGEMTLRIKSDKNDVLNYSISSIDGRVLTRNVTRLNSGSSNLKINVSDLPNGVYLFNGITINSRETMTSKIVKMSE